MLAFSKVTDTLLYSDIDDKPEIAEELYSSLRNEDFSTVSSEMVKITLPPRILPARGSPISVQQWPTFFKYDGSIASKEAVNRVVFHGGVDPKIRKDVWYYLLELYPWDSTFSDRERIRDEKKKDYYRMKSQWSTISNDQMERFSGYKERKHLIEKDVMRTDRNLEFFADDDSPHLKELEDILMTYVMYNFDLGYVQGMSDLLAPLLFLFQDEVDTFWCFTTVIQRLIRNFDIDQAGMTDQLKKIYQILAIVDPDLASHLKKQESSNMFFCFRWLLVWFKREFTFDDIYKLWDVLWAKPPCTNYHLLVCVAILNKERDTLVLNNYGFTEILKHFNELSNQMDVNLVIQLTEAIYLQLKGAIDLPNQVRSILGFTLIEEDHNNGIPDKSGSTGSSTKSSPEDAEESFERSINMQFI